MKNIESELKKMILENYKSLREFAAIISMPYTTLSTILKRGLLNSSVNNIIRICNELSLNTDMLSNGLLVKRTTLSPEFTEFEYEQIRLFRCLSKEGTEKANSYLIDLCSIEKYKKNTSISGSALEEAKLA